jgi:hypothetical protein
MDIGMISSEGENISLQILGLKLFLLPLRNVGPRQTNLRDMHLSLLHPLGTMSHRVSEGDLKRENKID